MRFHSGLSHQPLANTLPNKRGKERRKQEKKKRRKEEKKKGRKEEKKKRKKEKKNSLVNSIRPLLRLNRNAAAPHNLLIHPLDPLRALQHRAPVAPVARVQHHAGLVRPQLRRHAREGTRQLEHRGALGRALDQPVPVVPLAGAVGAAVAAEAGQVLRVAEREVGGRGKVVDRVGRRRQDLARRERALVVFQVARRVGEVEGVVPDFGGRGVAVGVEVEVGVLGEEDGWRVLVVGLMKRREGLTGLLVEGVGGDLDLPGVLGHRVRDAGLDAAEHALRGVGCVQDGEGDGVLREGRHVEVAERPVVGAAVQRVVAVVLLRLVRHAVNRVLPVADAVGVPAWDGVVHRVAGVLG